MLCVSCSPYVLVRAWIHSDSTEVIDGFLPTQARQWCSGIAGIKAHGIQRGILSRVVRSEFWEEPAGFRQVSFVLAAELFNHHPLFSRHPLEIENSKREQAGEARDVVRQNHRLRNDQQPKR